MASLQEKLFFLPDPFCSVKNGHNKSGSTQEKLAFFDGASLLSMDNFISLLHTCKAQPNLALANALHFHACRLGVDINGTVANCLVPAFAESGGLPCAQQIFNKLTEVHEFSCQPLIQGYLKSGALDRAMLLLHQMQEQNISFSNTIYIMLLSACAQQNCLEVGQLLHETIRKSASQEDFHVSNALVDMYAKCASMSEAAKVFDTMTVQDIATWSSLISGFSKYGRGEDVIHYLKQMELAGLPPNSYSLLCGLKACACTGSLHTGLGFHIDIIKKGLENVSFIGNSLVHMYSKCHSFVEARKVLHDLPLQTTVSWNALMSGYIDNYCSTEAIACFDNMLKSGICPDTATYCCALKACSTTCATVFKGYQIHSEIVSKGWEEHIVVGTALVDKYAKSGHLHDAYAVFCSLPVRNTITWNALIAGYAEQGLCKEALECARQMCHDGVACDSITYASCLKAASVAKDSNIAEEIHVIIDAEAFTRDPFIGSTLVDTYVKCGSVLMAQKVFDMIPVRDIISWTALMTGYVEYDSSEKAITCFHQMELEGVVPNSITYLCLLRACGNVGQMISCQIVHSEILKKGYEGEAVIGNSLLYTYINCNSLSQAWEVFNKLEFKSVVSWNTLIFGLVENGYCTEALKVIEQMQDESVFCDAITFYFSLNACNNLGEPQKGMHVHAEIAKEGFEDTLFVGSSLIDFYVNHGLLREAKEVFDDLPARDVVSWTALIAGFAEKGLGEEAWILLESMKADGVYPDAVFWNAVIAGFASKGDLEKSMLCFFQMQEQGMLPDATIYTSILEACGYVASMGFGKRLHACVHKQTVQGMQDGFLMCLVEFYLKCGHSYYARAVFDEIEMKGLVAWNTLIAGFAHLGRSKQVFSLYRKACQEWHPDRLTFLSVLNACCHDGFLVEALDCFETMGKLSWACLTYDHCNCIIDLLARLGHVMEAFAMLERLPFEPDIVTWTIILGACQKWGNVLLGREAFYHALSLKDKQAAGTLVMMSNMHSDYEMCEMA